MPTGTVKWFNRDQGFGFIMPDDGSRDIYIQSANVTTPHHELFDGQRVEYELTIGRKGPEAINVKSLS